MPGIADDVQPAVRCRRVQIPCASRRTNHVVAALNNVDRDVCQSTDMVQNEIVWHENPVREVMAFDAREGHGELQIVGFQFRRGLRNQVAGCHFPSRPFPGCGMPNGFVSRRQASVVRPHQIATLWLGDMVAIALERVGENVACTLLVEPREFTLTAQENTSKHKVLDALGMVLRVDEGE